MSEFLSEHSFLFSKPTIITLFMDQTEVNVLPAGCKESFSQSTFIDIKQKDTSSCSGLVYNVSLKRWKQYFPILQDLLLFCFLF